MRKTGDGADESLSNAHLFCFFLSTTFSFTPETLDKCIQKIDIDFKVTFSVQKICTFKSVEELMAAGKKKQKKTKHGHNWTTGFKYLQPGTPSQGSLEQRNVRKPFFFSHELAFRRFPTC